MSFAIIAAPSARSMRTANVANLSSRVKRIIITTTTTSAAAAAATRQPQLAARQFSTSRVLGAIRPEDHSQWRRDAVAALNRRQDPLVIPHNPQPKSRGGLITPQCYSARPEYLPILLDPLPDGVNVDIDEDGESRSRKTLDSTRPPPLELPTQEPDQSTLTYYLALGKAYLRFYKNGLLNIRSNWRDFRELRSWIQPFTIVAAARYSGQQWETKKPMADPATGNMLASNHLTVPHISRRDLQLYYRTLSDLRKLIPFGLVLLVCGELTPLAIPLFGNAIVPMTCRIPSQQERAMNEAVGRFREWKQHMNKLTATSVTQPRHAFDYNTHRLEHPWRRDMLFAYLVGQSSFARPLLPLMSSVYFHSLLHKRLARYWERIFCDTILIRREGGFAALSPIDIYEYALNYGSISLLVIMEHELKVKKNSDFVNEKLRDTLAPILEREADAMFQDDFTRLMPHLHWMRAYRNTALWRDSPDVLAAVDLLKQYPAPVDLPWGPASPSQSQDQQHHDQAQDQKPKGK